MLLKCNLIYLELRHEENIYFFSSSARIVQLAKTKVITHFLTHAKAFSGSNFSHATQKASKSKRTLLHERCKMPSSYRVYNLMKLKLQKKPQKANFNFGICLLHTKTGNKVDTNLGPWIFFPPVYGKTNLHSVDTCINLSRQFKGFYFQDRS